MKLELTRIRSTPDDTQLGNDIVAMQAEVNSFVVAQILSVHLNEPHRSTDWKPL